MTTIFLHGFWGGPADWSATLARLPLAAETWCPDLYQDEGLTPEVEPLAWADRFLHRLRAEYGPAPKQLVGYSMGGRLALHALLRAPGFFARTLILSADPLPAATDADRARWEDAWAARFVKDDWATLARDWDRQPVLATSTPAAHRRDDGLRPRLVDSLRNWSVRRHAFGRDELAATPALIDWAFGAADQKYVGVAERLTGLIRRGQVTIIPGAGHRLTHDAPEFVARWVSG